LDIALQKKFTRAKTAFDHKPLTPLTHSLTHSMSFTSRRHLCMEIISSFSK